MGSITFFYLIILDNSDTFLDADDSMLLDSSIQKNNYLDDDSFLYDSDASSTLSDLDHFDNHSDISELEFVQSDGDDFDDSEMDSNEKDVQGNNDNSKFSCKTVRSAVKNYALDSGSPHTHVKLLLRYLKPFHSELPVCASTLLETRLLPKPNIVKMGSDEIKDDGEFIYIGIKKQLQKQVYLRIKS